MIKLKSFKLFAGIALFVEALTLMTVIVVLSIQKKSIPKAVIAVLAAGGVLSVLLLLSHKKEGSRRRKLREMDAFYDYDYEMAYNGLDDDDEDYELDIDEDAKLIPGVDDDE